MTELADLLVSVWQQALKDGLGEVSVDGARVPVGRTRAAGLKVVSFAFAGTLIDGIEQNPEKPSNWGKMAREGKRIMQFRARQRFFANVCEGRLTRYPAWKSLGLPE